jgi:hypothetical protein
MGTARIALCGRCRRETLPQRAKPSWHREKHRATAHEREPEPDPRAERIKRRKEARQSRAAALRKINKVHGMIAAAKFFLSLKGHAAAPSSLPPEDCEACLKLQSDAA